jgi:NADH dehydrogenase
MTLVDHSPRILRGFDEELSTWAADHMRRRGIDLRLSESVAEVSPTHVTLGTGQKLPCHTTIWAAGIASPALLASLDLPKDKRGYLLCDPDTRVRSTPNVYAIGDCASNPGPDGKPFPALAQHALGEGVACARNVAATLRNQPTRPLNLRSKGMIAAFGQGDAVAKAFGVRLTGFPAWFLFRTVYLMKMPGVGRKIRVAIDWTLDLFSRHEPTSLGLLAPTRRPSTTASTAAPPSATDRAATNRDPTWPTDPSGEAPAMRDQAHASPTRAD